MAIKRSTCLPGMEKKEQRKNENIATDVLLKICTALNCDIGDIVEVSKTEHR